jgi:hypothetical protein
MRKMPCLLIWTYILLASALARPENVQKRLTENDPLVKQATEMAPYFKYKADIYLRRLADEPNPAPLMTELAKYLRHIADGVQVWPDLPAISEKRLLKGDATAHTVSTPVKVNDADSACWQASAAYSNVSNLYLLVWQDERKGTNNPDIYGQYFSQSLEPVGTNFRIHSENSGAPQTTPAVAATSDGGFVVVWEDYRAEDPRLYYRCFTAARTAKAPEAQIDETLYKNQYFPAVAADNLGYFTVVWLQDDDGDFNIYSRKFNNAGVGQRVSFQVNLDSQKLQWEPAVASWTSGETLIVWEDKRDGNSDVFGQRMRADGTRQAGNFKINDDGGATTQWRPGIAAQSGQFIVCWEDYQHAPNAIYAQWFGLGLIESGSAIRVDDANEAGLKENPVVAIKSNSQSFFTWQDSRAGNWDVFVSWFSADRVLLSAFPLNSEPLDGDQTRPEVLAEGNLLTVICLSEFGDAMTQQVFAAQYNWTTVPVELAFFRAEVKANEVHLAWTTLTESSNLGFELERKAQGEEFKELGFIRGHGTTTLENSYTYIDKALSPGAYTYRLKQMDCDGEFAYSNLVEIAIEGPAQLSLSRNYPNPFNSTTRFDVVLPERQFASLTVRNSNGQLVRTLHSGFLDSGVHPVIWDARDESGTPVTSGLYWCCLETKDRVVTRAMMLLR